MVIRNFTERAVEEEIARIRNGGKASPVRCWCPLCESDVRSLSLVSLPPSYGREDVPVAPRGHASPAFVGAAVEEAAARVLRRPKHSRQVPLLMRHQVRMVNLSLEMGVSLVGEAMAASLARCLCPSCQADTLAFALNRFPSLYAVECDGQVNISRGRGVFLREELLTTLESAARAIGSHPRH